MNAEGLLRVYEQISEAPNAVARLRRFILDLAVRGKLVEQDAGDEPVTELLQAILEDKQNRAKSAKDRKAKAITPLPLSGHLTEIPASWSWVTFGDLTISRDGERKPISKSERETRGKIYDYYGASGAIDKIDGFLFDKPLLLIGEDGANLINRSTPIAFIVRGQYWVNNHAHVLDGINEGFLQYLELFINATDLKPYVTGTAQPKMNQAKMNSVPVAVPPIAEQHRIVAKVDELMGLCDRLEAARVTREEVRDKLTAASLARLTSPDADSTDTHDQTTGPSQATGNTPAAPAFHTHARFALESLPALTSRPDQIKTLRQTILNLAVRGKLVDQDPTDEPSSELLKRISVQKAQLEKEVSLRKRKPAAKVTEDEHWFPPPNNWGWSRLVEIGQTQTGTSPSSSKPELFGDSIPFVKPADLDGKSISYGGKGLSAEGAAHSRVAAPNSVMMVCIGATLGKVNVTDREVCFNQQINSVTPFLEGIQNFVALSLKSSDFQRSAWARAGTGTLPIISKGRWEILPIPIPPLAEQHRIVAKVDALIALCDRLEAALTTADTTRTRLLEALLQEALTPATPVPEAAE